MPFELINPPGLARSSYSHTAVVTGGRVLFVSGQVALDEAGQVVAGGFAEQTERVFDNLEIALAAGGARFEHIAKMNTYVRDLTSEKVRAFREIRQRRFGPHQPASTLVATPALVHEDLMLEVEAIAVVDD
ncbi:MAG: RidA family protein [Burkholderiales bacterium]|nr:MAG: RidA family protein [Burkholderiales bacterium]